jgi:hypothetical protein
MLNTAYRLKLAGVRGCIDYIDYINTLVSG